MGQSSGGAMVSSLLLSPLVPENLFQRMIVQSGSVFAPWTYALDPVAYAIDIAQRARVSKNASLQEINDAFIKMDVYELIKAANEHFVISFCFHILVFLHYFSKMIFVIHSTSRLFNYSIFI